MTAQQKLGKIEDLSKNKLDPFPETDLVEPLDIRTQIDALLRGLFTIRKVIENPVGFRSMTLDCLEFA